MKFKVGDSVVGNKHACVYSFTKPGWTGVVSEVLDENFIMVKVSMADKLDFKVHQNCFDKVRRNSDRKIVVTVDGETITACLYNGKVLEKSAEAKCSPADRFDFKVGAGLAVDRLLGREAPKPGMFPLEELQTGRFGRMSNGEWFVVIEDHMLYLNGGENWDRIGDLDKEGKFPVGRGVDVVVEAVSLSHAKLKVNRGEVIWSRAHGKV